MRLIIYVLYAWHISFFNDPSVGDAYNFGMYVYKV